MKYSILFLALFLALFTGCTQAPAKCDRLSGTEMTQCIISAATVARNSMLCDDLKAEPNIVCLTAVANAMKSTQPCEGIADPRSREFCRRDIFTQQNDPQLCAQLLHVPAKDSCYDTYARSRLDWHICGSMSMSQYREDCIEQTARKAKDVQGCIALSKLDPYRDDCIFSLSIESRNLTTCFDISDVENRAFCVLNIAVAKKDPTVCDQIPDQTRSLCAQLAQDAAVNRTINVTAPSQTSLTP